MFLGYDLLVLAGLAAVALSSPVLYDQRQTGDVNVHVHLKDVQVVALLESDLFNDSEYDYIYDYADFTIKPIKPTTGSTIVEYTPEIPQKTDVTTESSSSTEEPDVTAEPSSGTTLQANVTVEALPDIDKRIGEATESPQNSSVPNNDASGSTSDDTKGSPAMDIEKKEASTLPDEQDEDCISLNNLRAGPKIRQLNTKDNEEASGEKPGDSSTESYSQPTKKRCRYGYSLDVKGCCRRVSQRRLLLLPLMMKLAPKVFDDVYA